MKTKISYDKKHIKNLNTLAENARKGTTLFATWAQESDKNPKKAVQMVFKELGHIIPKPAWDVFAKVYNEDSPDYLMDGLAKFVDDILSQNRINKTSLILDAATGTGTLPRSLYKLGYRKVWGFDQSSEMLKAAKVISSNRKLPIKFFREDISKLTLSEKVNSITWIDFSTNFSLDLNDLAKKIRKLLDNVINGGILIFDVRTFTGWDVDFFKKPITFYETPNFQRIWLNQHDNNKEIITFDIFIRVKTKTGRWDKWNRETFTEKKWRLGNVKKLFEIIKDKGELINVYDNNFNKITLKSKNEPSLVYFVLKKI